MSDFAELQKTRRAKEQKKSYASRSVRQDKRTVQGGVQGARAGAAVGKFAGEVEGLYSAWPESHFEIRTSKEDPLRGQGVFSRKHYRPGDISIAVKPDIFALSISNLSKYCSACASPSEGSDDFKRCSSCKTVYYCNAACQNRDWRLHKQECAALQLWANAAPSPQVTVPSDAVRCLGRILWRKKSSGGQNDFGKEIDAMQSHRTLLQPSVYEMHIHLAHALVRYLDASSPEDMREYGLASIADLVDLISRFTTNTVALTTSSLTPIGACVSTPIALLNHSCDPNVVMVFPRTSAGSKLWEPLLHVVAIKAISPGEELLTSYIDTTIPSEERRTFLKETYCFDCKCSLCMPTTRVMDPREALLCPTKMSSTKEACDGSCEIPREATAQTRCNACRTSYNASNTAEIVDAIAISKEGLAKSKELQYKDPERAIRLTSNLIGMLTSAGLAPGAHPLLALSRLHSALLVENLPDLNIALRFAAPSGQDVSLNDQGMSARASIATLQQAGWGENDPQAADQQKRAEEVQKKLDDAIRAALRTCTGLACVLVPGHPLRGLALTELGKLLSVDELVPRYLGADSERGAYPPSGPARLRLAKEMLVRSRSELMIGFGGANEGGEIGREVRGWLVRAEKELEVWTVGLQNV